MVSRTTSTFFTEKVECVPNKSKKQPQGQKKRKAQRRTRNRGNGRGQLIAMRRQLGTGLSHSARRYLLCLKDPFHPDAYGARVPDGYAFPTITYCLRDNISFTTSPNGDFTTILACHPYLTSICIAGMADIGTNYTVVPQVSHMASTDSMDTLFSSWRVVGGGYRFMNLQPMLSGTGRLAIAPVVGGNQRLISVGLLENASSSWPANNVTNSLFGFAISYADNPVYMPGSRVISTTDFFHGNLQLAHHPITPTAVNFNTTPTKSPLSGALGVTETAMGPVVSGDMAPQVYDDLNSLIDVNGMPAWYIHANGYPADTRVFQVEVVIHLEGVPNPASGLRPTAIEVGKGSQSLLQNMLSHLTVDNLTKMIKLGANFGSAFLNASNGAPGSWRAVEY